jgi:hypothetical protein
MLILGIKNVWLSVSRLSSLLIRSKIDLEVNTEDMSRVEFQ